MKLKEERVNFRVVAIEFSTFVMNLVGTDADGNPIEDESVTASYACNSPEVAEECRRLQR